MTSSTLRIYPIRGLFGYSYLIVEVSPDSPADMSAILIDACFGCTPRKLAKVFIHLNLSPAALRGVHLTHAHFDHVINAAAIQHWNNVPIYCPAPDKPYLLECAKYRGANKVGGMLEAIGRVLWHYKAPQNMIYFSMVDDHVESLLPDFKTVSRVSLPGHTPGHTGYYIRTTNTLIAGDLFAGSGCYTHTSPRIFTDEHHMAVCSIKKAAALAPESVFVCHTLQVNGARGAVALRKLAGKIQGNS